MSSLLPTSHIDLASIHNSIVCIATAIESFQLHSITFSPVQSDRRFTWLKVRLSGERLFYFARNTWNQLHTYCELQLASFQNCSSWFLVKCVLILRVDVSNYFRMTSLAGSLTVCDISTIIFNGILVVIHYAENAWFLTERGAQSYLFSHMHTMLLSS